ALLILDRSIRHATDAVLALDHTPDVRGFAAGAGRQAGALAGALAGKGEAPGAMAVPEGGVERGLAESLNEAGAAVEVLRGRAARLPDVAVPSLAERVRAGLSFDDPVAR